MARDEERRRLDRRVINGGMEIGVTNVAGFVSDNHLSQPCFRLFNFSDFQRRAKGMNNSSLHRLGHGSAISFWFAGDVDQ